MSLNLKQLLIRNTFVQSLAQGANFAAGFVVTVVLSRYLGVRGFGEYSYIFAFFFFFHALNDLGVGNIIIRQASQDKAKLGEMVSTALIFKLAAAVLLMILSWIVIQSMGFGAELRTAMALYALSLPVIALELPMVIFQVHLNLVYSSVITIFYRIVYLALILTAVWLKGDLRWIIGVSLIAEVFYALFLFFAARSLTPFRLTFNKKFFGEILKPSLVLWGSGILIAVNKRADFIMLERMKDLTQVGLYAAANRIPGLLEILPLMLMNTLFPVMSASVQDVSRLTRIYRKIVFGMGAVSFLFGVVIAFFSTPIVSVVFGASFQSAAPALSILIWSTVAIYISISGGNLLVSVGWEKITFWLQLLMVAVDLLLNFAWIPKFGFIGASWAEAIASWVSCITVMMAVECFLHKQRTA